MLPLTSASETGNSPVPSPFLGATFPNSPRSLPHLLPRIHCCKLLSHGNPHGIRYWDLHASTSLPGTHRVTASTLSAIQCLHCTRGMGPFSTQQRAGKKQLGVTGSWQHRSARLCGGCHLLRQADRAAPRQPSLSAAVAAKNLGMIKRELGEPQF